MDWDFIALVGTMLFFAALRQWPPDGRRWEGRATDDARAAQGAPQAVDPHHTASGGRAPDTKVQD